MTDLGIEAPETATGSLEHPIQSSKTLQAESASTKDVKTPVGTLPITGFVAGILSGVTKLVIGTSLGVW